MAIGTVKDALLFSLFHFYPAQSLKGIVYSEGYPRNNGYANGSDAK